MSTADDTLTFWMNQAGRYPLLADDEILRLSKIIHTKGIESAAGKKAVDKLVRHNLRLIPMVVRGMLRKGLGTGKNQDLICDYYQAGTLGLYRAASLFDYTRGYKFSTYAFMWIRQSVQRQRYVMNSAIHVPETYYNDYHKFSSYEMQEEMRRHNPAAYERHLAAYRVLSGINNLSVLTPSGDNVDASADPAFLSNTLESYDTVEDMMSLLDESDDIKYMVVETCVNGKSIADVSKELKVSREAASKKIKRSLESLKVALSC